jgi:GWxTD domain-containing protein
MTKRVSFLVLALGLGLSSFLAAGPVQDRKTSPPPAQAKPRGQAQAKPVEVKSLDPIFQDFLKLTTYIITPKEKDVFLRLTNDRDRTIFVDSFWKIRDPTPGTPENEYKEEINRRFAYVNKRFAAGRPGWMTDRGRFYMILGEPASYDRFPGTMGIVPCEVWYYYTDGTRNLPSHFGLIFYRRQGAGDYRLYDPFVDGPKSLMENMLSAYNIDPDDYETIHDKIREMAPTLADISISLIPGEFGYGYQPTSRNTELIAAVIESPKEKINPTYATHFFDYKGMVSTEYLTNYIESQGLATVIQDPILNIPFLHFAVSPLTMTLDYYGPKKQYYCDIKLDVSLRRNEEVIHQYSREFPLYFPEDDVERVRHSGLSLEDSFPVPPGDYKLTVLIQNTVGKEFSVFERTVSVPAAGAGPALNGPFIGYKVESYQSNVHIPFKAVDRKLDIDPKMTFGVTDEIAVLFNVTGLTQELWQGGDVILTLKSTGKTAFVRNMTVVLANSPFGPTLNLAQVIPPSTLTPDYYQVSLSLVGPDKKVLDQKSEEFVVSTQQAVAHPIARAKGISLANQYYFFYQLAQEYDKMGMTEEARSNFARGFSQNPGYKEGVLDYARFLLRNRDFDPALSVIESLKDFSQGRYEYLLVKGLATMGKGDFAGAIDLLQGANKIYNSDTILLNALGGCYMKTNQPAEALAAYKASLKLNDKQEEIKKILASLEKK